ncbi:MAG: hypothetical protein RI907_3442 [Pseudomonadota bacterium]|jgi:outer membrane protein
MKRNPHAFGRASVIGGATLCLTLGLAAPAQAQSAGSWLVRGGLTSVMPKVKSGELSAPSVPDTRIDVTADTVVGGGVSYMLTDHVSVDLPLALPIRSRIQGDGAIAGSGDIGYTKSLPATVFLQYRFGPTDWHCRPYVGAGPTYAYFMETTGNGTLTGLTNPGGEPTTMKIQNKLGFTVQAGVSVSLGPRVFVDLMVGKTKLKTRSTLSTGQTIDVRLDPVSTGVYLGYRF